MVMYIYLHTIELDSHGFNELVESYDHNSAPYILHSYFMHYTYIYMYICMWSHTYTYTSIYMHDRRLHDSDIHECNFA